MVFYHRLRQNTVAQIYQNAQVRFARRLLLMCMGK